MFRLSQYEISPATEAATLDTAPPWCYDNSNSTCSIVSLAAAVNESAASASPIGLGRTSSSGSKKRIHSRESEVNIVCYVISSMATSRRVSEFPGVFGISESDCGQQRWTKANNLTYYFYIDINLETYLRSILQSFNISCKSCKHPLVDHVQTSSSTALTRLRDRRRSAQQGGQWVCRCRRVSVAVTRTCVLLYASKDTEEDIVIVLPYSQKHATGEL